MAAQVEKHLEKEAHGVNHDDEIHGNGFRDTSIEPPKLRWRTMVVSSMTSHITWSLGFAH